MTIEKKEYDSCKKTLAEHKKKMLALKQEIECDWWSFITLTPRKYKGKIISWEHSCNHKLWDKIWAKYGVK